jgi:two-component system chemotaxis response regulator CheB
MSPRPPIDFDPESPDDPWRGTGDLSGIGCPGCPGVLRVADEGHHHHKRYTCRIGHTFSLESMLAAKEEQLEDALWGASVILAELAELHKNLVATAPSDELRERHRARVRAALARFQDIRRVVEHQEPFAQPATGLGP